MFLNKPPVRKVYSIYKKNTQQPYLIHIAQQDHVSKTTALTFIYKQDAIRLANVLEYHKNKYGDFPDNTFYYYEKPFKYPLKFIRPRSLKYKFNYFYIQETSYKSLLDWCNTYYIDLMIVHNLRNKFDGQLIKAQITIDQLRTIYQTSFLKSPLS
jgi:hypothetical protein